MIIFKVVLYLHSTSNHNIANAWNNRRKVVLYLHSTSNHNRLTLAFLFVTLYYIFILHQTTTARHRGQRV